MDAKNLKERYPVLVSHLKTHGYGKCYIDQVLAIIRKVIWLDGEKSITSYEDLFKSMNEASGYSMRPSTVRGRKIIVALVRDFDLYGILPDRVTRTDFLFDSSHNKLSEEYKAIVDRYVEISKAEGVHRVSTMSTYCSAASVFFKHLQDRGVSRLEDVTEDDIISFFFNGSRRIHGRGERKGIAAILENNDIPSAVTERERILDLMPPLQDHKTLFPYLTDDEDDLVRKGLCDNSINLILRDRAIVGLSYHYGLRASDIRMLRFDNIDWENEKITIIQSKTGNELVLPLLTEVGNMVLKLVYSNPSLKEGYLFTNTHTGEGPLSTQRITSILSKFLAIVGVRTNGGLKGARLLRHNRATRLLSSGVPAATASSILGHADPNSLEAYIDADIHKMREMSISVEQYPVPKEVFEI